MAQDRPTRRGSLTPTGSNSPAALAGFGRNYAQRAIEAAFFGSPIDNVPPPTPTGAVLLGQSGPNGVVFTGGETVIVVVGGFSAVTTPFTCSDGTNTYETIVEFDAEPSGGGWWFAMYKADNVAAGTYNITPSPANLAQTRVYRYSGLAAGPVQDSGFLQFIGTSSPDGPTLTATAQPALLFAATLRQNPGGGWGAGFGFTDLGSFASEQMWAESLEITAAGDYTPEWSAIGAATFEAFFTGAVIISLAPPPGPIVDEGASTGAVFTTVGAYRVATFTSGGTLVVTQGGEFEYLLVAGGGAGGSADAGFSGSGGGGGGGGGVLEGTATFSVETYTIAVGAGGTPAAGAGTNGENSSITGTGAPPPAVGGGRGGSEDGNAPGNGGSGGGGAFSVATAGTGTAGQGFAGGNRDPSGDAGGGGGAGEAGTAGSGAGPGPGGDGVASSITGTEVYYGGGGAAARATFDTGAAIPGGLGGGGNSPQTFGDVVARAGLPGTDGLGGGGGGSSGQALGGAGGDGIVIIRWIPAASGVTGGGVYAIKSTRFNAAGATEIDWTNPITAGLFFAAIGPNPIFGAAPYAVGAEASTAVTTDGLALQFESFGSPRFPLATPVTSANWTLLARASMPDLNAYQVLCGVTEPTNTDRIHLHSVIFPLREFGVDARPYKSDHAADASYLFPRPDIMTSCGVVINTDENNIRLYCDGEERRFDVLNEGRAATFSEVQYFAKNETSDVATFPTRVAVFLAFARALTPAEMDALQDNPWQVFK